MLKVEVQGKEKEPEKKKKNIVLEVQSIGIGHSTTFFFPGVTNNSKKE